MENFSDKGDVEQTTTLLLDSGPGKKKHSDKPGKIPVDPIYGEDAVQRFVQDHFDKGNPFEFKGVKKEDLDKPKDLTIFVNLAANRGLLNSSLREDEELRKLEKLTKDKPVTVIVQTAMNRDMSLNHLRATKEDLIIGALGGLDPDKKQTEVVRYEMANGSKKLLYAGYSRGLTEDLSDLLKADPAAMKADRVVLLNRAHGMAMHGLRGDAGNTSIADLKTTLGQALSDAGKKRFDVIDFDSCLIGNAQTLTELGPVAKYMIASEEPEVAIAATEQISNAEKHEKPGSNAQPLAEAVKNLIESPALDTKATAQLIFSMNEKECKTVSKDGLCGANTLGLYDGEAAPAFSTALDHFGKALLHARALGTNENSYQSAAKSAPEIDGEPDGVGSTVKRRDLGLFVKSIKAGLDDGTIRDTADGELAGAVSGLQSAMSGLTTEHFNSYKPSLKARFEEVHLPPAALDGISVVLHERQPAVMKKSFDKQVADDSIPSQPNWNQFVKELGDPGS